MTLPLRPEWRDDRPVSLGFYPDPMGGVPVGVPREPVTLRPGRPIALLPLTGEADNANPELYRMHTAPHLFFEEQIHTADDAWLNALPAGHVDWDCHGCEHTVHAPNTGKVRCPRCWKRY